MSRERLAVLAAFLLCAGSARAAFQSRFDSPRTAVLGGSALAAGPEPMGLFVNPAGVTQRGGAELYFSYDKLYAGVSEADGMGLGSMAVAVPTKAGTLAAGVGTFTAPGLAHERTIALGFARDLTERFRAGVAVKQLEHGFSPSGDARAERDPVFAHGDSRSAYGLDLGAVAFVSERALLSFAARDVNRPDVGLATEDRVPMDVEGGLAIQFPGAGLKLTADAAWRQDSVSDGLPFTPRVGVEKSAVDDKLLIRAAVSSLELSAGFGLQLGRVGFDYALVLQRRLMGDGYGSHRLGMSWRFGAPSGDGRLVDDRPAARAVENTLIRQKPVKSAGPRDWAYSVQ